VIASSFSTVRSLSLLLSLAFQVALWEVFIMKVFYLVWLCVCVCVCVICYCHGVLINRYHFLVASRYRLVLSCHCYGDMCLPLSTEHTAQNPTCLTQHIEPNPGSNSHMILYKHWKTMNHKFPFRAEINYRPVRKWRQSCGRLCLIQLGSIVLWNISRIFIFLHI
jgi:hypothetical protein